jgi:heparin/heparan-sulfate lyase
VLTLMTAQQRAYVVTRFTQIAATMEIGFPPSRQGAVVGHGSDNQLLRDQLSAAIAFYDEAPLVYNIVAGRFFADYIAPRNYAYAAQAYHRGHPTAPCVSCRICMPPGCSGAWAPPPCSIPCSR